MKTHVGINGAAGRMGQRLVQLVAEDPALTLSAALEAPDSPCLGRNAGELCGTGSLGATVAAELPLETRLDVLIDFSTPEATLAVLPVCVQRSIPIIVATTGFTPEQREEVEAAAHMTAVLFSPNLSLSVNVLFALVRQAARLLADKDFDVEIVERHHRFKKDAPSGTALHFASIIQEAMGVMELRHGRSGTVGSRPQTEIGVHALRAGDSVGEHTIVFSTLGESLELTHRGHTRDCYARGALLAAKFLAGRPPGRYTMHDVLGLGASDSSFGSSIFVHKSSFNE
jgi:4-hydroxy-tetrahydrodipicolinate reductase